MEIALASAALIGTGMAWRRMSDKQQVVAPEAGGSTLNPAMKGPQAANDRPVESSYASARARSEITEVPAGALSGRRDHSSFLGSPSPYEQQMERVYRSGRKQEVEKPLDPSTRQDNVLVRSQTDYQKKFLQDLDKPNRMHNVNPIATTTGTASQLVGPGLAVGAQAATGSHGMHYGMVRMRPEIVHNTFREQKGSVIPGKNPIDQRPAEVALMNHAAAGFNITSTGFAAAKETNPEPLKFHAISEEYLTSAPGRAIVTGDVGAGGIRPEPSKVVTNRGNDNPYIGARAAAGLEAPDSRMAYANNNALATNRGKQSEAVGPAQGAGQPLPGHQLQNFHLPAESRQQTEMMRGHQLLNIKNPGQPVGVVSSGEPVPSTQRQSMPALDMANLSPQAPSAPGMEGDVTRSTARAANEYRPGAAGGVTVQGGQAMANYVIGPTMREAHETAQFTAPMKAVGLDAPMSYSDILSSEGYSNRDVPQIGFVPPAAPPGGGNSEHAGIGRFETRPEIPNAARNGGGGVANQHTANFHIVHKNIETNPNRTETYNQRLDPHILDALTRNELSITT